MFWISLTPRYTAILIVHSCFGASWFVNKTDAMSIEAKYFLQIKTDANRYRTVSNSPRTVNRTEACVPRYTVKRYIVSPLLGRSVVIFGSILTSSFWHVLGSCIGHSHFHLFSFKYFNRAKCLIYINLCIFRVKKNSAGLQWYSCARYKAPGPLVDRTC